MANWTRIVGILFLSAGTALSIFYLLRNHMAPILGPATMQMAAKILGPNWANVVLVLTAGVMFLGIYSLAMSTERYVKGETLVAGCAASLENLDRIISELGINGNAIFLPKSYVGESRVFLPARPEMAALPDLRGDPTFFTGASSVQLGLLISPPGHRLCILLEQELGIQIDGAESGTISSMLPPMFSHGLGLAKSIDIDEEDLAFVVRGPICSELCDSHLEACRQIGCPICSSICEVLSRSLDKALRLESLEYDSASDTARGKLTELEG